MPITALVALSAAEDKTLFPQVIQTPGDLDDFLTVVRTKRLGGVGNTITHTVQGWLQTVAGGAVGGRLTEGNRRKPLGFTPGGQAGLRGVSL